MDYLLVLLGLFQLGEHRRTRSVRALLLGAGLALVGVQGIVGEDSALHPLLSFVAWPVLLAALFACWRDGSLAETYLCWRRDRSRRKYPAETGTLVGGGSAR